MFCHFPYNIILNKNNKLVREDTTSKEIPEFRCASYTKGGRCCSETSSFLRMQESITWYVVNKRTNKKSHSYI